MKTTIDLFPQGIIDQPFLVNAREWAEEVIKKTEPRTAPDRISIHLWKKEQDFQGFDAREKAELGVVTGGESDFLATHEAWRGFPRIHISLEKIQGISEEVVRGVIQHEIAHALLHGKPEFYQFRYNYRLMEAGHSAGFDFPILKSGCRLKPWPVWASRNPPFFKKNGKRPMPGCPTRGKKP